MTEHATAESATPPVSVTTADFDPRVQLAAERTLLAWIRTGLALMGFGFVVARFSIILQSLGVDTGSFIKMEANVIGLVMVMLGVACTSCAPWHYRGYFERIRKSGDRPFAAWWLARAVSWTAAAIGVALVVYLLAIDWTAWTAASISSAVSIDQ